MRPRGERTRGREQEGVLKVRKKENGLKEAEIRKDTLLDKSEGNKERGETHKK